VKGDGRSRRALFAVLLVGLVALVCLLLGHRAIEGWLDEQRAKKAADAPTPALSGVVGSVSRGVGAAAAGVKVRISWRDAAGRPGTTPAVTDAQGHFNQGNVPAHAELTEVRASQGPLVARLGGVDVKREGTATRADLVLPKEFRLAGLLRRSGDRAPIPGATLAIGGVTASSGASGQFVLEHVPEAALSESGGIVRIEADGFRPMDWPVPRDDLPETYGDLTILLEPSR
jgi:hypothetical protein